MSRPDYDLPEIRRARANLDRLARDYPRLIGETTTAEWEAELEEALAQDNTAAERQRRRRQRLKEEGLEETRIPLDQETRALLSRLLQGRGYEPLQAGRLQGTADVIREALALLEQQDQAGETPAGSGMPHEDAGTEQEVKLNPLSGGGYEVYIHGTYVGHLYRGTFRGKSGWEGQTPEGQKVGGQKPTSAARRLAEAMGVPYPG